MTETAFGLARGLQYAAIALAVGGLAFLLLAWLPALGALRGGDETWRRAARAFGSRLRLLLLLAAGLGAISAAAGVVLEGAEAAGISGFSALKETIVRETLETKFGTFWGLALLAWIVFGGLVTSLLRRPERRLAAPAVAVLAAPPAFLVLVPALAGHGSTQSPVALMFPVNVIHVAAMGVWLGGLATLLFVAPRATRELAPGDCSRLLAGSLARFSQVAFVAVAAILFSGLIQAYVYVRRLDALIETGYGRAVLIKFLLLVVLLIPLGAYNRRRSVPRLKRIAAGGEPPGAPGCCCAAPCAPRWRCS